MLSKKQFDVLTLIESEGQRLTQRKIAEKLNISLGTVNKILSELNDMNYLCEGIITEKGIEALEPYRVQRMIILAAGFGSRLVPVTLTTPKPLVRVNGRRIIDSILDAALDAEIDEIYIVRGYLGKQFDQLLAKYPMIQFIENPAYSEENNISSAMRVRHLIANSYLCDADLLIYNPELISKYQYQTNYIGVAVDRTDDWCLLTKNGIITQMCLGGTNCYHMFDITYWTSEDGTRLARDMEEVYHSPGGRERYWDQVALEYKNWNYRIAIRPCHADDIVEIDSYSELKALDNSYV